MEQALSSSPSFTLGFTVLSTNGRMELMRIPLYFNVGWIWLLAVCHLSLWILLPIMDWKPVSWSLLPIMDCLRSQIWMKFWKNPKKRPFANSKYTCNYISKTLPFIKGWFILDSVQTRWKFIFFHQAWEYLQPGKFSPVWQSRHGSKAEGDSAG